ncbi:TonB-dependent receptor [Sphingobium boeckii]|uniref:Iron complex outermembrane receptor protein n=1 Tax=Sphingobium boeckii TaxID=1082345 RepID=A0A7W9EEU0_9SPHN|nr:TonB-dependent receptor [Sphingobium boeckii]MBB5686613.1 iron complex outermembrane receptor protein [Sphingobium boeckii]
MTNFKLCLKLSTAVITCAITTSAFAQEAVPADQPTGGVQEIIVTAQKRSQNLQDVPLAISVVSGAQLESGNVNSAEQLFQKVPTLTFRKGNTNKDSALSIRGVGTISFASGVEPSVSTVIDGVVYARTGQQTSDFLDVDRIEVLRGPQGSLFGKNASAGVISIITREPSETPKGYFDAAYYEGNELRIRASASGPLANGLLGSLTGFFSRYDGNGRNVFNNHEVNGYKHWGVRGKLIAEPSDNVKIALIADFSKGNDNGYADSIGTVFSSAFNNAVFIPSLAPLTLNGKNKDIDNDLDPLTRDKNSGVSAQVDVDLGAATLTSITAYRHWYNYQQRDGDFRSDSPTYVNTGTAAGDVRSHDRGDLKFDQFTQELRIASSNPQFLEYVAGVYYYKTKEVDFFNRTVTSCTASTLPTVNGLTPCTAAASTFVTNEGNADFTTRLTSYSAFGQLTANFSDVFRGVAGLRHTNDKVGYDFARRSTSTAAFAGVNPAFASSGSIKDNGWSGNAGLQFDVNDDIMSYVSYTRGYKGPAINVFFNMLARDTGRIDPETSNAYEAGLKTRLFDRRLTLNLAAFYAKYNNYQANFLDLVAGQVVTRLTNAGTVSTRGVELDFNAQLTDDFSLNGGFNYTDAHINKFICPTGAAVTCADAINGKPLPFAPKYKGTVTADWRLPLEFEAFDINLNSSLVYQSRTQFDINQNPNAFQSAYAIWDAGITLRTKDQKYSVSLIAKNLTDKQFVTQRIPNGTSFMRQITPRDAERYFGVSGRVNF